MVFFINIRNSSLPILSSKYQNNKTFQDVNGNPLPPPTSQAGSKGVGRLSGKGTKRTNTAICLYVPEAVSMNHTMSYKEEELGIIGQVAGGNNSILDNKVMTDIGVNLGMGVMSTIFGEALGKIAGVVTGVATKSAGNAALAEAIGSSVSKVLSDANIKGNAGAAAGVAVNPHNEVLFQGVEFRKFEYKFSFYPKSKDESEQVEQIINAFRFHMHPEIASWSSGRFFIYPSDFDITFWHWDETSNNPNKENGHIYAASTCVLESMDVNYTPAGQFITHREGYPVGIEIVLRFKETEIMTKDRLAELEFKRFNTLEIEGGE